MKLLKVKEIRTKINSNQSLNRFDKDSLRKLGMVVNLAA